MLKLLFVIFENDCCWEYLICRIYDIIDKNCCNFHTRAVLPQRYEGCRRRSSFLLRQAFFEEYIALEISSSFFRTNDRTTIWNARYIGQYRQAIFFRSGARLYIEAPFAKIHRSRSLRSFAPV